MGFVIDRKSDNYIFYIEDYGKPIDDPAYVCFYIYEDGTIEYDTSDIGFVTLDMHNAIHQQINEIRLQFSEINV